MIRTSILLAISFLLFSCGKDDVTASADYRDDYVGTYDCTKSYDSFDDPDPFDIEVTVVTDTSDVSRILVNDLSVELLDDGTFGQGPLEGGIDGSFIQFYNRPIVNGLILPCFIQGQKN